MVTELVSFVVLEARFPISHCYRPPKFPLIWITLALNLREPREIGKTEFKIKEEKKKKTTKKPVRFRKLEKEQIIRPRNVTSHKEPERQEERELTEQSEEVSNENFSNEGPCYLHTQRFTSPTMLPHSNQCADPLPARGCYVDLQAEIGLMKHYFAKWFM